MTYKRIIDIAPDVVFINWWTIYWQPAFVYMARRLRRNGIKVIYLCHNVYDHDASRLKKRITGTLIKSADGFLVHAEEQKTLLSGILGDTNKPILVRQLPVYDIMPEPRVRVKDPCDQSYKLKVLFIGLIRPYKGLDVLIEAYSRLKKGLRDTIELRVVGEYWGDKIELEGRLNKLGIKHDLRFVTDQEAVDYIGESDLLALPYKSASGSAVVPLAYYCGKPVIVTSVGGLVDVVEDRKTGWVIEPNNAVSLAEKLSMISRSECSKMEKDIQKWVNKNSWDEMAKELMKIFVSNK